MWMAGDIVSVDLGTPVGSEAGFLHPALVVTAQPVLDAGPNVVQVVPLTSTISRRAVEIVVVSDPSNGLDRTSAAQCQHVRSVARARVGAPRGNVGPVTLGQVREILGLLLDVPG